MRQKNAFSLIEVLLVMGIIAVITSMGLTISQKGIEKAYNQYWYTGYSALADATKEAILQTKLNPNDPAATLKAYSKYVAIKLMGVKAADYSYQNSTASFTAPNGIGYEISYYTSPVRGYYKIIMTIPRPKMQKEVPYKTILIYNFDPSVYNNSSLLYPSNETGPASEAGKYLSLQNRADLLPFYNIMDSEPLGQHTINKILSFREAYCNIHNSYNADNYTKIVCSGNSSSPGALFSINPRKVF